MAKPRLHWLSAKGDEQIYVLDRPETLIGRKSDADIILGNQHISRHHARIVHEDGQLVLIDMSSTQGTFVNHQRIDRHVLQHGDRIGMGKDLIELHFFSTEGAIRREPDLSLQTAEIFEKSITNLDRFLPSGVSDLEKISLVLDFQSQWEQSYTSDAAFLHILRSALKISGAERGYVLVRSGSEFVYAAGMDGSGRSLSESEFRTSHGVVNQVVDTAQPVFMIDGIQGKLAENASIVAMNLRAVACLPLQGIPAGAESPEILGILYLDSRKSMHSLSGLDERILNKLALEAGNVLERVEMIKGIEQRKKLEQELALAQETQKELLPQTLPDIAGFRIRAFSKPTRYVGGDFYDFIENERSFTGVLADVSGKGIAASLLSSMTLGCLEMQLRSGFSSAQALSKVNKFLCERSSSSKFVTMCLVTLDHDGEGAFLNAGHNPAFLFRGQSGEIEELHSKNIVVGAFAFASYDSEPLQMTPGDVLVIYSDGLTEAENPHGQMLGEEVVKEIICAHAPAGAEVLEKTILEKIQTFTEGYSQTDDITLMIVEKV